MEDNTEQDRLRLDILKVKRKLYLSYPKGSVERDNFVLQPKKQELELIKKTDLSTLKLQYQEAFRKALWLELQSLVAFGCPLLLLLTFAFFFKEHLWLVLLSSLLAGICICFFWKHGHHLYLLLKEYKSVHTAFSEKESHLQNLTNEIQKLSGNGPLNPN